MIRDITLGQYYAAESLIHRLDPRVKLISSIMFIVALFVVHDFVGFAICIVALSLIVRLSKVPLFFIFRGMKPLILILLFTFVLNIFMVDGEVLWRWGFLKITDRGIYIAVFMALRLMLLIISSSILTLTTKPIDLTDGIEFLLSPLEKIKVPAHDIAMMMSIALRFIPTLLEETDKIIKAQQARGADFETGNFFRRAKALIPILVPLFISAFRIAQDLAMAMEARCYRGGKGRTRMNKLELCRNDFIAISLIIIFFAVIVLQRILKIGAVFSLI